MSSEANKLLNQSPRYRGSACMNCGRSYPEVMLDVVSSINNHSSLVCEDQRDCKRAAKKEQDREWNKEYRKLKKLKL